MSSVTINRGSDLDFVLRWKQSTGGLPVDLTGYSVTPFEAHAALTGRLTLAISGPTQGEITGRIEWNDAMPSGRIMSFRVKLSMAGQDQTSPTIWVVVE